MRQREIDRTIQLIKKSINKLDKMEQKYSKKLDKELNEVGKRVIDDWYSDYIPNLYHRKYSLYKAFKVEVKDGNFNVSFSPQYMRGYKHRARNSYIYDISFIEGWHGGANNGPDHPFPGYPMYREPHPFYTNWYFIAERSFSPYERMCDEMNKTINIIDNEYEQEFQREILDKLEQRISQLKGGT